jgi:hypothetical protein
MRERGYHMAAFYNETKTINARLETKLAKPAGVGNPSTKSEIEQIAL